MIIKDDEVFFKSTGNKFYANNGIIGLSTPDILKNWQVSYGFDGGFGGFCSEELGKKEKIELAKYMIKLWKRFKREA